jgi:hypothetical protein
LPWVSHPTVGENAARISRLSILVAALTSSGFCFLGGGQISAPLEQEGKDVRAERATALICPPGSVLSLSVVAPETERRETFRATRTATLVGATSRRYSRLDVAIVVVVDCHVVRTLGMAQSISALEGAA